MLDASTGAYKRHWGAYGKAPSDEKLPVHEPKSPQFANPVHCVRLSRDGLVYVCDRANNRVQVFRKDGTFVKQFVFEEKTLALGLVLGPGALDRPRAEILLLADGTNDEVRIVERDSGEVLASFGRPGRYRGRVPLRTQHRRRLAGQPVHHRGRHRQARAEIPALGSAGLRNASGIQDPFDTNAVAAAGIL